LAQRAKLFLIRGRGGLVKTNSRPGLAKAPKKQTPVDLVEKLELDASIFTPGGVRVALDRGFFFTLAQDLNALRRDAIAGEIVFHRLGTPFAEREVVFGCASFIAMPLYEDVHLAVFEEVLKVFVEPSQLIAAKFRAIEIEIDDI